MKRIITRGFFLLMADDDEGDVFLLHRSMEKACIPSVLHLVVNGAQTLDYLTGKGKYTDRLAYPLPDVIALDLNMPLLNGFDVLTWIRQQADLAEVPVVAMSADEREKTVQRVKSLGANAYLQKEADVDQLGKKMVAMFKCWKDCLKEKDVETSKTVPASQLRFFDARTAQQN